MPPRVGGEVLAHRRGVAEHGRGGQAAPGDIRIGVQDLPGLPHPAIDRGGQERRERLAGCSVGFERGGEPRPAGKAQFAGDDQLGGGQPDRAGGQGRVMAGQALNGRGITGPGGVAQLFGAAAQLAEIGALGKRFRHGVSLRRLRSAAQAEEEAIAARAS